MTEKLFVKDSYIKNSTSEVVELVTGDNPYVILNGTIFYALGGGQPGDVGEIKDSAGHVFSVIDTRYDKNDKTRILHFFDAEKELPNWSVGDVVELNIDWQRRHRLMRMHSAMHLLCAIIPEPVTGGGCGEIESRVEFDMQTTDFDKTDLSRQLNEFVQQSLPVDISYITDRDLDENPDLVRTMSVQPPRGNGTIRMIRVGDNVDYQPCGGTHVKNTSEIGELVVTKIKSKGKKNKRVSLALVNP